MSEKITNYDGEILKREDLPAIYQALSNYVFAAEAVEATRGRTTGKGYDTTGYRYQFLVNAMNEVLGSSHWRTPNPVIIRVDAETRSTGRTAHNASVMVTVQIGNSMVTEDDRGKAVSFFDAIDEKVSFGDHVAKNTGDAIKGAFTNGLKKTFALFGLGADAYTGALHKRLGIDVPGEDAGFNPDGEPSPNRGGGGGGGQSGANSHATAFYAPSAPYSKSMCHQSGMPLTPKQLEYCKEEKIRPTHPTMLAKLKNDFSTIKLTEGELANVK